MSSWSNSKPLAIGAYLLAAALATFELAVLWLALHPDVPPHYRAYYVDRTSTCLPQPVSGDYVLGSQIDFRSGGPDTRSLLPCGWDGPAGDGMHAVGEQSQLRFAVGEARTLTLMLELTGVTLPGPPAQRVDVRVNDVSVGQMQVPAGETLRAHFAIAADLIGAPGMVDVELVFPDAILPAASDANTRKRSIKLVAASLGP